MKTLPLNASDQDILDAVREWVGLLVEEQYVDAYKFFCHEKCPPGWTPDLIATLIQNYGSTDRLREEIFKVTSLDDAKLSPPHYLPMRHDVHRYRDTDLDGYVWFFKDGEQTPVLFRDICAPTEDPSGYVWFDLPLNGYASHLTATMDFCVVNDHFVFVINDIHVM